MTVSLLKIVSPDGRLQGEVDVRGGMLAMLYLLRPAAAKPVELLHRASWLRKITNYYEQPAGLDDHLSGEWACVPFGWVAEDSKLFKAKAPHGLPCHSEWQVQSHEAHRVMLHYTYPDDNPLQSITRTLELTNQGVKFSFSVLAREDVHTTLGAHPVFPLTGAENQLELSIQGQGIVYGIECESGISRLKTGERFESLSKLPLKDCLFANGTRLPFPYDTEEIVQMLQPQGLAVLNYPNKQVRLELKWDKEKVPTCLLWMSNRGRKYAPWNGENCCLGIEPIVGAWDLAEDSLQDNPVSACGVPTWVELTANQPWQFDYAIEVFDLK